MNEFWHTTDELEPPIGKNVWTTLDPFRSAPKIRLGCWNGSNWGDSYKSDPWRKVYWASPINRKSDEQ